jgi:hypothetical protein
MRGFLSFSGSWNPVKDDVSCGECNTQEMCHPVQQWSRLGAVLPLMKPSIRVFASADSMQSALTDIDYPESKTVC